MSMRKIGVVGTFAAGAALALAPLASADTTFDMTDTLNSEIASMNSMFQTLATLSGIDADDINTDGTFYTFSGDDLSDNATFASLLYGFNWEDEMSQGVTGSYNLYNGALTEFYDAYNAGLYALMNDGAVIDSSDLFGSSATIDAALAVGDDGTGWDVASNFLENGFNDIAGYFSFPDLDIS